MNSFRKKSFQNLIRMIFFSFVFLFYATTFADKLLIICHQNFTSTIQSYKTYKESLGYQVQLIVVPTDVAANSAEITNRIRSLNLISPIHYVQFVGDYEHIPGIVCYTDIGAYSDLLYGYIYGGISEFRDYDELDEVKSLPPTIAIGRFSVNTTTELQNIIDRTIDYEQNIKEDFWLHRAMGSFSGSAPPITFNTRAAEAYNLFKNNGFSRVEVRNTGSLSYDNLFPHPQFYDQYYPNRPYVNYLSEGHLIYWRNGHNDYNSIGTYGLANSMDWANYGKLCVVLSWGCLAGNHKGQECISERLLYQKNNGQNVGAIAVLSFSMATTDDSDPVNIIFNSKLFDQSYTTIGKMFLSAVADARKESSPYGNNQNMTLHLFGDVTLKPAYKISHPFHSDMILPGFKHRSYLSYGISDNYTYKATSSINTTEDVAFEIENGCNIGMLAGNSVTLKSGFHVVEGAVFSAAIGTPVAGKIGFDLPEKDSVVNNRHNTFDGLCLAQNIPNPFNPITRIQFSLPFSNNKPVLAECRLKVLSIDGRVVKELINEKRQSGNHFVSWNSTDNFGRRVPAGVYICTLSWLNFSAHRKMSLLY